MRTDLPHKSSPPKAVFNVFPNHNCIGHFGTTSTLHTMADYWSTYAPRALRLLYKTPTLEPVFKLSIFLHFLIFKLRYGFLNVSYIFTVTYQPLFPFDLTKPLISFLWSRLNTIKTWQWLKKIQYAPLISQYGRNKINTGKHSFLPQEFHHDSLLSVLLYRHISKQRRSMTNEQMRKYQDLFLKSIK